MGLRPQVLGFSLADFLATRTSDDYVQQVKDHFKKRIETECCPQTDEVEHDTSSDSPITEDTIRRREQQAEKKKERLQQMEKLILDHWFTHLPKPSSEDNNTITTAITPVPRGKAENEEEEEASQDNEEDSQDENAVEWYETDEDIQAVLEIHTLFCLNNKDKVTAYMSNFYNSGGYFMEILEAFEDYLPEQDIQSLWYLSEGRTLIIENAKMDIVWSSYSYLKRDEVSHLLKTLKQLSPQYHKAKEEGKLLLERDGYEMEDDEEEGEEEEKTDDVNDGEEPSAKRQKTHHETASAEETDADKNNGNDTPTRKVAQMCMLKDYEEEFLQDLIEWLTDIDSKQLDLFLYKC